MACEESSSENAKKDFFFPANFFAYKIRCSIYSPSPRPFFLLHPSPPLSTLQSEFETRVESKMRAPIDISLLTTNQKIALEKEGNVFIGGGVGTGKTETLLQIYKYLKTQSTPERVKLVTAGAVYNQSLGWEASIRDVMNLWGTWTGQYEEDPPEGLKKYVAMSDVMNLHTLIIDDVEQLEYAEWVALRKAASALLDDAGKPFGHLRIICAGDFPAAERGLNDMGKNYPFEDPLWDATFPLQVELEGADGGGRSFVHEPEFGDLLKRARLGELTAEDLARLAGREIDVKDPHNFMSIAFDDAIPEEYEDPLHGRVVVTPDVAELGRNEDAVTRRGPKPKYRFSAFKSFYKPPEQLQEYIATTTKATYPGGYGHTLQRKLRSTLMRKLDSLGDAKCNPWWNQTVQQVFALGEEVSVGVPIKGDDASKVYAGCRAIVTSFEEDGVIVKAANGAQVKVTPITLGSFSRNVPDFVEKPGVTPFQTFTFLPMSHAKVRQAADIYNSAFVNGYAKANECPTVIIDTELLAESGGLRSLYASLAHAPSLRKVNIKGSLSTLDQSRESFVYQPSAVFHISLASPEALDRALCPICSTELGGVCPMSAEDSFVPLASAVEKMRYCVRHFRYSPVDKITMSLEDFTVHSRDITIVQCECGETMPLRDVQVWFHLKKKKKVQSS